MHQSILFNLVNVIYSFSKFFTLIYLPFRHPEYKQAFGSKPRILRTPHGREGTPSNPGTPHLRTPDSSRRPTSRGSVGSLPPQPQYSESGPRPSSAGKSGKEHDIT